MNRIACSHLFRQILEVSINQIWVGSSDVNLSGGISDFVNDPDPASCNIFALVLIGITALSAQMPTAENNYHVRVTTAQRPGSPQSRMALTLLNPISIERFLCCGSSCWSSQPALFISLLKSLINWGHLQGQVYCRSANCLLATLAHGSAEIPQLRCCGWLPSAELKSTVAGATVRVTVTFALPLLFL